MGLNRPNRRDIAPSDLGYIGDRCCLVVRLKAIDRLILAERAREVAIHIDAAADRVDHKQRLAARAGLDLDERGRRSWLRLALIGLHKPGADRCQCRDRWRLKQAVRWHG